MGVEQGAIRDMSGLAESAPACDATNLRVALVTSRYHTEVTQALKDGAVNSFLTHGGNKNACEHYACAGVWEIAPLTAALCNRSRSRPDAIIAIGCVITGQTRHDQYISDATIKTLAELSAGSLMPIGLAILTCQTIAQALDRAGGEFGNKGEEAMHAALEQVMTLRHISDRDGA